MESLIIIIIFILLSNLGNGKKRQKKPQNPHNPPQTSAGQRTRNLRNWTQQAINEVMGNSSPAEQQRANPQTTGNRRKGGTARDTKRSSAQECGYCTGDVVVESSLAHHSRAAAAPKDAEMPCVDPVALQEQWQLSALQNALVWQEVLDKPLALRRRGPR